MGFNPENCKNHAAINTIIMAVKKRKCYKDRPKNVYWLRVTESQTPKGTQYMGG